MQAISAADIKDHLVDDTVFNKINKLFISLDPEDVRQTNWHLNEAFAELIMLMKSQSPLFDKTFSRTVWAGSFYKKTKIGSPDEYDLNLVIKLPIGEKDIKFSTNQPGYIKIRADISRNPFNSLNMNQKEHREMMSFIDDGYLNQEKFRRWIEGVLNTAAYVTNKDNQIKLTNYTITIRKSGPAFTLSLKILGKSTISIDMVPVLAFSSNYPPSYSGIYSLQEFPVRCWFAVPKPLRSGDDLGAEQYHYWRLSFYEYEKDILSTHGRAKPIIRQLKKLRDTQRWKSIASYYIETLCFHQLRVFENSGRTSSTFLFFTMLQKLHDAFNNHCIEHYWDKNLNLLENIGAAEMKNMERRLFYIIKCIKREIANDRFAIAKYILNEEEFYHLCNEFTSAPLTAPEPEPESESESESESEPESKSGNAK